MWRTVRVCLLAGCVLLTASAPASGQESVAPDKLAAVTKLIEIEGGMRGARHIISARMAVKFRDALGDSMIKDLRAQGYFKSLSDKEGAELERRMRVFLEDVFAEAEENTARLLDTPENLVRAAAPVLDKYFTLDELNQVIAFEQSPPGRKLDAALPELLADSAIAALEAKGAFNLSGSPEEITAKLNRLTQGFLGDPFKEFQSWMVGAAPGIRKYLGEDDIKALTAFYGTPLGQKFGRVYPGAYGEIMKGIYALYGPQVGAMWSGIYLRKLHEYAVWLSEATRPGARLGAPKPVPQNKSLDIIIGPPDKKPGRP